MELNLLLKNDFNLIYIFKFSGLVFTDNKEKKYELNLLSLLKDPVKVHYQLGVTPIYKNLNLKDCVSLDSTDFKALKPTFS